MIRPETLAAGSQLARVYQCADPAPMAGFSATFVLEPEWTDPHALWVKGMLGAMSRRNLREFLELMVERDVRTIMAKRADGHVLPMAEVGPDGIARISVERLVQRYGR